MVIMNYNQLVLLSFPVIGQIEGPEFGGWSRCRFVERRSGLRCLFSWAKSLHTLLSQLNFLFPNLTREPSLNCYSYDFQAPLETWLDTWSLINFNEL